MHKANDLRCRQQTKQHQRKFQEIAAKAPVVQKVDSAIRWITLYLVGSSVGFPNTFQLNSDLSSGQRYSTFEQSGPGDRTISKLSAVRFKRDACDISSQASGAPDENIVQNHLNIALLNLSQYLNGRYRHICIP